MEAAVLTALATAGPRDIDQGAVIKPFLAGDEAGRTTLYRWVDQTIARAKAVTHGANNSKSKTARLPAVGGADCPAAALGALLPAMASVEQAIAGTRGQGTVPSDRDA